MSEQAAGPSSGTAHDAAVQRKAATDDAGASLEPKHGHVRGAGHEPVARNDEEQQLEAQLQGKSQQPDEGQQRKRSRSVRRNWFPQAEQGAGPGQRLWQRRRTKQRRAGATGRSQRQLRR
jgi:hypothetical protein